MDKSSSRFLSAAAMVFYLFCLPPATAQAPIQYHYDEVGRLVGVTDSAGNSAAYQYDSVGNIVSVSRSSAAQASFIAFAPGSGAAGDTVTMSGSGFGALPAGNAVAFNGTSATIVSATPTRIVAIVPAGASTGLISVAAPAGSATSAEPFVVAAPLAPTISGFAPTMGGAGTVVAVAGTNFATIPGANKLSINGRLATTKPDNSRSMAAVVSPKSSSGKIVLATVHGSATSAGDFFVLPGSYTPADIEVSGRMAVGQSKTIAIVGAGKKGLILFDGSLGQRISLTLSGVSISGGSVSILAPGGATIGTTSVESGERFIDSLALSVSGTYTILVNPANSSKGNVTLSLNAVQPLSSAIVAGGSAATVTLTTPGQNAELKFAAAAGQRVSLNMSAISASLGCPSLSIVRPDGVVLAAFSNLSCSTSYFVDAMILPLAGQYTIVVDPQNAGTGSATFTLFAIPPEAASTIAAGSSAVTVTTSVPGENGTLLFSGTAGQRVSLNITAIATALNCPSFSILKPDGSHLVAPNSTCSTSYFIDATTLPADGLYKIVMDARLTATGSAAFSLFSVPANVAADIVAGGGAVKLTTSVAGQGGSLSFAGTAGQKISLNVTAISSSLGCSKFSIVKPDGGYLLAPTIGCGATFLVDATALPLAGTYTVVLDPSGTGTGSATFTLYDVPVSSGAIVIGAAAIPVSMTVPGQIMDLSFNGNAGQKVTVRITGNTVGCQAYSVRRPDASVMVTTTSCSASATLAQQTLATTGSYVLRLDPSAAKTGNANVAITSP